jgi:translocator protein
MKLSNFSKLFISIAVSQSAGIIGSIFTTSSISTWYVGLIKPVINPPNWIFGPVWVTLYVLMGVAVFLVWKEGLDRVDIRKALWIFIFQLFLNTMWSIIFFGFQSPFWALLNITLLWLIIFWAIRLFYKISRLAAWLMIPYILWVSFAIYLNYSILILN